MFGFDQQQVHLICLLFVSYIHLYPGVDNTNSISDFCWVPHGRGRVSEWVSALGPFDLISSALVGMSCLMMGANNTLCVYFFLFLSTKPAMHASPRRERNPMHLLQDRFKRCKLRHDRRRCDDRCCWFWTLWYAIIIQIPDREWKSCGPIPYIN